MMSGLLPLFPLENQKQAKLIANPLARGDGSRPILLAIELLKSVALSYTNPLDSPFHLPLLFDIIGFSYIIFISLQGDHYSENIYCGHYGIYDRTPYL